MKKLLAMVVAALLGLCVAMPAQAQSKIQFSGWYRALHHNLYNFNRAYNKDNANVDSFFEHRLNVNVDIRPTDDVLIHWTLRAPNNLRWGGAADPNNLRQGSSNAAVVYTRAIYATVTQDWGKVSIGRLEETFPTSMNGLKTLGYGYGTTYIYTNPFDYKDVIDGIVYNNTWDNGFGLNVYYAKFATQDPTNNAAQFGTFDRDVDYDRFGVEPFFKWEGGGAALHLEYQRDMRDPNALTHTDKSYAFFVNPAIMQSWGDFSLKFEGKIGWGKRQSINMATGLKNPDVDLEGLGFYLQATYNYGAGDLNLMGWFADGSSWSELNRAGGQRKSHDLVTMGDFAPFLVAYYDITLPGRVQVGRQGIGAGTIGRPGVATNVPQGQYKGPSNHWGIGLLGNHNFTDTIRFNWGIGHFRLVEADIPAGSKEIGVEVDLGVRIQLIKSVTFESQFGYMFSGKAYKERTGGTPQNPTWGRDAKDSFAWLNALQFAF
jgi:hypothetical protein